jgi:hypothetical protein
MTTKTPFSSKVQILHELFTEWQNIDAVEQLCLTFDLGFPLASLLVFDAVTLTDKGQDILDETWFAVCDEFGLDTNMDYQNPLEFLGK